MAVFERSTWVDAPLDEVWAFHSTAEGLVALTPDCLRLRVERVVGPDGRPAGENLVERAEVRLSVHPFGVGPRIAWTSRIVDRERTAGEAHFRDRMVEGPLPRWEHTHRFAEEGSGTRIVDRVVYESPIGPLRAVSTVVGPALEAVFAHRHRRARAILER